MNETVRGWMVKAARDHATAGRELAVTDSPNLDAVCFHAQQAVEKLMKALLIHRAIVPPRTHDLVELSRLLASASPDWSWPVEDLRFLTRASVEFRYPGDSADLDEATQAFERAVRLREKLLLLFGVTP